MSLRSFNPCFGFSRRVGAIAVSCFLLIFAAVFTVLCFSQLSVGSTSPGIQGGFAIASILQVVLVALASASIFASWKERARLIHLSAYSTAIHLVLNLITLACLLAAIAPIVLCTAGRRLGCSKLVAAKPVWNALSIVILTAQLYLSLVILSYSLHLKDRSRRPYIPEISSRSLSAPRSLSPDHTRLLSNSGPYQNLELSAVESGTTTRSFSIPEPEVGYGGGMRTYEEAEQNEKARLRRESEGEEIQVVLFPIPSTSGTGVLTPLGLQWRDGDLPPYAS